MDYPGRIIKKGEKDKFITRAVQERLNKIGFGPFEQNGIFDDCTETEVREFQSMNRDSRGNPLLNDGKLGPISWSVLFGVSVGGIDAGYIQPVMFTKVIEIAFSQVGVIEMPPGSNRGPEVEKYLRSAGCVPGDPWCASFVYWSFNESSKILNIKNPLVRTGSCMEHWNKTKGRKISLRIALNHPSIIRPGLIFIIDNGCGKGHTGIVKIAGNGYIETIEGNTNIEGSHEGLGVAVLTRKINSISAGFIDYS